MMPCRSQRCARAATNCCCFFRPFAFPNALKIHEYALGELAFVMTNCWLHRSGKQRKAHKSFYDTERLSEQTSTFAKPWEPSGRKHSPPASDPRFSTVTRMELTKSVNTPGYAIRRPKEGFDRLTANRTNYSLGEYAAAARLQSATAELQMKHPRDQPPVDQPAIGGPTLGDGSYRLDTLTRDNVRRGGGGGEGVLGVRFDVVNGREDGRAREKVAMRAGPRRTLNNAEKETLHPTDGWGDVPEGMYVDILTGKERKKPQAPERGAGAPVRSDTVSGRTRPW